MAQWIHKKRLFRRSVYICSCCGYRSDRPYVECPNCGSPMDGSKYDPEWVDEIEEIDAIFDD